MKALNWFVQHNGTARSQILFILDDVTKSSRYPGRGAEAEEGHLQQGVQQQAKSEEATGPRPLRRRRVFCSSLCTGR